MERFLGMMPPDEVESRATYKDKCLGEVIIQAGPHGYSIIYHDGSVDCKDIDNTTNTNFELAYNIANEKVGPLEQVLLNEFEKIKRSKFAANACEAMYMDTD